VSRPELKRGDRVRVTTTIEGTVTFASDTGAIQLDNKWTFTADDMGLKEAWEVLAPPEPPVGSIARDSRGNAHQRKLDGWHCTSRACRTGCPQAWDSLRDNDGPVEVVYAPEVAS
jgi:hypothetical protein